MRGIKMPAASIVTLCDSFRLSRKVYWTLREFLRFCLSRKRSRAAKPAKNENIKFSSVSPHMSPKPD